MWDDLKSDDFIQNASKSTSIHLPFKCAFCILNFATEEECHSHNREHFKEKCNICNVMVIEIAGCWFELKLHIHQNACDVKHNKSNADIENVNSKSIAIESSIGGEHEDLENEPNVKLLELKTESFAPTEKQNSNNEYFESCYESITLSETLIKDEFVDSIENESCINEEEYVGNDRIADDVPNEGSNQGQPVVSQKDGRFYCDLCDSSYTIAGSLRKHKKRHLDKSYQRNPYCQLCKRAFYNTGNFTRHMKSHLKHSNTDGLITDQCEEDDNKVINLTDRPVACTYCDHTFKTRQDLIRHIKRIHADKSSSIYTCNLCEQGYSKKSALKKHMLEHGEKYDQVCSYCNKIFKKKSLLSVHIQVVHLKTARRKESKTLKCANCDQQFEKQKDYAEHLLQIHNKKLPFKCEICDRAFLLAQNLKTHTRTHSDTNEFICSFCGKGLRSLYSLNEHLNGHTGNRPYECKECGKKFMRHVTLKRHCMIHTGEKPFKCKIEGCNAAYRDYIDRRRHLYRAHGIYTKKFECSICPKVFPENKLLKKHLERHEAN